MRKTTTHFGHATPAVSYLPPPPWGRAGVGGLAALALSLSLSTPAAADTAAVVQDHIRPGYAAFDDAAARLAFLGSL